MPTYTYQCDKCGNAFEQFQKFAEDPLTVCPSCDGTVRRVIHAPGIVFKGSGWYITDTRKPSGESGSSSGSSATPSTSAKSETSKSESTKSEPAAAAPAAESKAAD